MKKILSIFLSALLLLSLSAPPALAAEAAASYPTVIVAGYSASDLYLTTQEGRKKIWGVDTQELLSRVLSNIAGIGRGLGALAFGHPEYISDLVGQAMVDMYGVMAYTPNGESVNDIHPYSENAADTQFSYLYRELGGEHAHEPEIMRTVAELYGENGYDQIFAFQTDFRQNIIDIAADLDRYIDNVRAYTGKDKVNLFAVSHGGEITSVYLHLYGAEKKAVNNAVLTVPAIGGAALAYDVMSENVVFDEETLFYFIENGTMLETDIDWLVRANQFGILDDVCNLLVHNYVKQILGYWGSMWDFIPGPYYDQLKETYLDRFESSELIRKSDIYHYEILPTMTEKLNACREAGINVYIIAGSDIPSVTGLQESSDAIITVNSSTGAYTAPYGQRFADGYRPRNTVCADPAHNHLSPAMTVDATCAYLPETTWFVNGLFHGMTWHDPYAKALASMLLFSDEPTDVRTYEAYPQFKFAENRSYSVLAAFDRSPEGYVSGSDGAIVIRNLSDRYPMRVLSVQFEGCSLTCDAPRDRYIAPGKSVNVPIGGVLPETSLTTVDLTVTYMLVGSVTPAGSKTYTFTVMNGEPQAYNAAEPFTAARHVGAFESRLSDPALSLLKKTGLFDLFSLLFNMLVGMLRSFRTLSC